MWLKVEWFTDLHALPKDAFTVSECTLALGRVAVDVWILNSSCSIYYRWTSCCSVQVKTTLWPPGKGSELPTALNHHFLLLSSSFRVERKQSVSVSFTELYPSTVLPPVGQKWRCIGAGNFQTICPVFKHDFIANWTSSRTILDHGLC